MESRPLYDNLSPLDHRYSISEPELFARLSAHLSEEAVIRSCARVEEALLVALIRRLAPLTAVTRWPRRSPGWPRRSIPGKCTPRRRRPGTTCGRS